MPRRQPKAGPKISPSDFSAPEPSSQRATIWHGVLARTEAVARARENHVLNNKAILVARDADIAKMNAGIGAVEDRVKSLQADLCAKGESLVACEAELAAANALLAKTAVWTRSLETDLLATEAQLGAILATASWRITIPFRGSRLEQSGSPAIRRGAHDGYTWITFRPGSHTRRFVRRILIKSVTAAIEHKKMKAISLLFKHDETLDSHWPTRPRKRVTSLNSSLIELTYRDSLYRARNKLKFESIS
jgi:hypothetical protein